ncbi:MAG: hypothetical protein ACI8W3_003540, partial [Myxococcota bacterium]
LYKVHSPRFIAEPSGRTIGWRCFAKISRMQSNVKPRVL